MQYYENVMELKNNTIVKVCEIPDLPKNEANKFYGKIFSKNNQLFMTNGYKIFILKENKPVFFKNCIFEYFF